MNIAMLPFGLCFYRTIINTLEYVIHGSNNPYSYNQLHKSHNAAVPYPTIHHIVTEMCTCVHIYVTKWCIVGYLSDALWYLWLVSSQNIFLPAWPPPGMAQSKISDFVMVSNFIILIQVGYILHNENQSNFWPTSICCTTSSCPVHSSSYVSFMAS